MRVAFHFHSLHGYGTEKVILNLANALVAKGVTVDVVLDQKAGNLLAALDPRVNLVAFREPGKEPAPALCLFYKHFYRLYHLVRFILYVRKRKPDIIVPAYEVWSFVALVAKLCTAHKTHVLITKHLALEERKSILQGAPKLLRDLLLTELDGLIAVSTGVADSVLASGEVPADKIHVIYNPIYDAHTAPQQPLPDHPWFKPKTVPVLLSVGRLEPDKNHVLLLRAFKEVVGQKEARLIILGEGSLRGELESQIKQLGLEKLVVMPGRLDNPKPYFAHADLYVSSSNREGLPTVLIEALAFQLPVVATNCPSGCDEILDKGKYGTLVPMRDANALSVAILSALEGQYPCPPPMRLQRAQDFSVEKSTNAYLALFSKILSSQG